MFTVCKTENNLILNKLKYFVLTKYLLTTFVEKINAYYIF